MPAVSNGVLAGNGGWGYECPRRRDLLVAMGPDRRHPVKAGARSRARLRRLAALTGWHRPGRGSSGREAVKLLAEDGELCVFSQNHDRVTKERAMRRRQLKWLWKRLRQIVAMEISREELLMKLGGARTRATAAWRLVDVEIDKERPSFTFVLNRKKLRTTQRQRSRPAMAILHPVGRRRRGVPQSAQIVALVLEPVDVIL